MNEKHTSPSMELDNYISPSRLKLWLKCPLAYRLRYIDGVVTPTTANLFLGHIVHRALEFYHLHRKRGITLSPEVVCEHIQDIWTWSAKEQVFSFKSRNEERELRSKASELVAIYLAHPKAGEPRPFLVEERLQAPLVDPRTGEDLGIALVGIVDLVVDGPRGPIVADFKTASRSSNGVDIIHELQLTCYSYLFRHLAGQKEHALEIRSLIKTKTPKVQIHRYPPRTDEHFGRLFSVIRSYQRGLESGDFHIRPGIECTFCDYRKAVCQVDLDFSPS